MQEAHFNLPIGSVVPNVNGDRYVVEEVLGKGGSSAVYLVQDRRRKQGRFALKEIIDPDRMAREHFAFEAEVLMRLDHEALPHVYRVFENEKLKRIYILMDYIEGKDLEVLRNEQPDQRFSLQFVLASLTPIVAALNYLHHREPPIIHRDIKPANIIMPVKGGDALLVDFGIAKEFRSGITTKVAPRVSPGYASIEQYNGGTDIRTDVYGLGATIYTLLTGVIPMDSLARITGNQDDDPLQTVHELVPAIPLHVSEVISRAMSVASSKRFATVNEFWIALNIQARKEVRKDRKVTVYDSVTNTYRASDTIESTALKISITGDLAQENETTTDPLLPAIPRSQTHRARKDIVPMTLAEHRQIAQKERRRNTIFAALGVFILLFALGGGVIEFVLHTPRPMSVTTTKRVVATAQLSSAVTPTIDQSPYPTLASSYVGSMHDYLNDKSVNSFIEHVQQNKGTIRGSCNCLGLTGEFRGTVDVDGTITFTVPMTNRGTDILFQGHIKTGGDMAGQFYIIDATGQHTGEYGDWSFKQK